MTVIGTAYFTQAADAEQLNKDFAAMVNSMLKGQVERLAGRRPLRASRGRVFGDAASVSVRDGVELRRRTLSVRPSA